MLMASYIIGSLITIGYVGTRNTAPRKFSPLTLSRVITLWVCKSQCSSSFIKILRHFVSGVVTNEENTGTDAGRALFILWSFMAVPVGSGEIVLTKARAN